jgi:type I restriction enzyme S subunit
MFNYTDVFNSINAEVFSRADLMVTTATADKIRDHAVRRGDILLTPSSETAADIGRAAVVRSADEGVVYSYHLTRFRPAEGIDSRFLTFAFNSRPVQAYFSSVCTGTTRMVLSRGDFQNAPLALPPVHQQSALAAFLDRETGKIDALVEEQRRLIELLKEKRKAVISHAVTRGLDPNARMKPSGVDWLGDVPGHWEVRRIKTLLKTIEQGWSPQCENYPASKGEWGVLKVGCVNGGLFNPDENKALPQSLEPVPSLGLRKGDVLVSRANTRELVGSSAVIRENYPQLLLCDKLYRLQTSGEICVPEFLALTLGTPVSRSAIEVEATGASSSMLNIAQSTILELAISVPPVQEQAAIVRAVELVVNDLDRLAVEARRSERLLQERRSALISAVVTGKLEVREPSNDAAVAA